MILPKFKRAVLVVAHPDDETLWCGGLVLRHPGDWTIICCSIPRADPIRAWKFFDACEVLGAKGRLMPFVEPEPTQPFTHMANLGLNEYDLIVTHGGAGEYGHAHHKGLHFYITALWPAWCIGTRKNGKGQHQLALTGKEMNRKFDALKKYDHVSPLDKGQKKYEALVHRYELIEGFTLDHESYDFVSP